MQAYRKIVNEANLPSSNILIQFKLKKIVSADALVKPSNISDAQFGEFVFDILKIDPTSCLGIDLSTGRYDTKELLVKADTDLNHVFTTNGPHVFKDHEITAMLISTSYTKVTFRQVPLSVPDEEILHLCQQYGVVRDEKVHREPIAMGTSRSPIISSTRYVEMQMDPGKYFRNYYWLAGPLAGETGRRITVLHSNQPKQCSWCFRYAPTSADTAISPSHCPGNGDGRTCKSADTPRAKMSQYIDALRFEGYVSLRDQYQADMAAFPSLNQRAANKSSARNGEAIDELAAAFNLEEEFDFGEGDQVKEQSKKDNPLPHSEAGAQVSSSKPSGTAGPKLKPALASQGPRRSQSMSLVQPTENPEQVRISIEKPILEYIINDTKVEEQQVKDFALHALMCKDIVLREDPETKIVEPVVSTPGQFLSKFRKAKTTSSKKKRFVSVEQMIWSQLKNSSIQQQFQSRLDEASTNKKGGARLFSESEVDRTESQESKTQRVVSPPKT